MTSVLSRQAPIYSLVENGTIQESHLRKLLKCGYETVGQVALIETPMKAGRALGIPGREMVRIVHAAQLKSQHVIRRRFPDLPPGDPIYFDIETDLNWKRIWLIGVIDTNDNKPYQFYANDWDCERDMLIAFDEFLKNRPSMPLLYYSCNGFDVRIMRNACNRLGLTQHAVFTHPEQDLCYPIRRSYYIPTKNRKLKTLAGFLGFDMSLEGREDYMDGRECAEHYIEHAMFKTPLDPNVFVYNLNDVKMLPFVMDRLAEIAIDQSG